MTTTGKQDKVSPPAEVSERNVIFQKIEELDHHYAPYLTGTNVLVATVLLAVVLDSIVHAMVAAMFLKFMYVRLTGDVRFITCPKDMPLVQKNSKHLGDKQLASVKKVVKVGHPLLKDDDQPLDSEYFMGTKGFVVRFNLEGVKQFENDENFAFMQPYWMSIRNKKANAFVANLLICNETEGDGFAVGLHVDTSVGIKSHKTFMAHQVDVWYCQVPQGMEGGELELFTYDSPAWGNGTRPAVDRPADQSVRPEENVHVTFRGDAHHQVRGFKCPGAEKAPRVSLVVEQYIIDENYYWMTKQYEINRKEGMNMM